MARPAFILMDRKNPRFAELVDVFNDFMFNDITDGRTPSDALSKLPAVEPELIVLDWEVAPPDRMTDFLQKLRKLVGKRSIPVVIFASEFTQGLVAISSEYNVTKILLKGTIKSTFKPALQNILNDVAQPSPIKNFLNRLDQVLEKRNQHDIDVVVEEFYKNYPDHPRSMLEYGNLLLRRGESGEAQAIAEKALKGAPNNLRAMNLLSRVMMHLGRRDEALRLLQQAELVSPKNLDRLVMLGDCFYHLGDAANARTSYSGALDIEAQNPDARKGLGVIELDQGNVNRALDLFRDSASEEELAGFFNNAAIVAVRSGDFEVGLSLYDAAKNPIKSKHLLAKVFFNSGLAYRKWNKLEKANQCFIEALDLDPSNEKIKAHIDEIKKTHQSPTPDFIRTPLFDMVDDSKSEPGAQKRSAVSAPDQKTGTVTVKDKAIEKDFGKIIQVKEKSKDEPAPKVNVTVINTTTAPKAKPSAPASNRPQVVTITAKPNTSGKPQPKFFDDEEEDI